MVENTFRGLRNLGVLIYEILVAGNFQILGNRDLGIFNYENGDIANIINGEWESVLGIAYPR